MAKKVRGVITERQFVHNTCGMPGCDAKAVAVLYVPPKGKKGMRWSCENGHMMSTRQYRVEYKK